MVVEKVENINFCNKHINYTEKCGCKNVYHYHLTFENKTDEEIRSIAKANKAKVTEIDLYDGEDLMFRDRMITRYATDLPTILSHALDAVSKNTGCIRVKVERMVDEFLPVFEKNFINQLEYNNHLYLESHIKIEGIDECDIDEDVFAISTNPNQGTTFINCRIYNQDGLDKYFEALSKIPSGNIIEQQMEVAVYDNNLEHDGHWA